MERLINRAKLEQVMEAKGLSQTSIAKSLSITKASVSKWVTGKSFPRPAELLRLGKLLGVSYSDLVTKMAPPAAEPLVAFRKRANTKTTEDHLRHAKEMGQLLAPVVKHLGFSKFLTPSRLKDPSLEYAYIQDLAECLRKELGIESSGPIQFTDLIGKFRDLQAVIIPVLWGQKQRHENALHIYLPESKTTWIYLNIDSHLYDFKFWMAHELGHVLAVQFLETGDTEQAEDFSDAFAGALLFPKSAAQKAYEIYMKARVATARIQSVLDAAAPHQISPFTVYREVENYAQAHALPFTKVEDSSLFSAIAKVKRQSGSVSEGLFDNSRPSADHYIRRTEEAFKTPIFSALSSYIKETGKADAVIERILDIPRLDAKEMYRALS